MEPTKREFASNTSVSLTAPSISFEPGTVIEAGCNFSASPNTGPTKSSLQSSETQSYYYLPQIFGPKYADANDRYYLKLLADNIEFVEWELSSDKYYYIYEGDDFFFPENVDPGQYTLRVNAMNNFSEIVSRTKVIRVENKTSEIQNFDYENDFFPIDVKILPNPSEGKINIEIKNTDSPIIIKVLDLSGRIIYENQYLKSGSIDLSKQKGMFIIKITYGDRTISRKILCL